MFLERSQPLWASSATEHLRQLRVGKASLGQLGPNLPASIPSFLVAALCNPIEPTHGAPVRSLRIRRGCVSRLILTRLRCAAGRADGP